MILFGIDVPIVELLFGMLIISVVLMIQSIILVYILFRKINKIVKIEKNNIDENKEEFSHDDTNDY